MRDELPEWNFRVWPMFIIAHCRAPDGGTIAPYCIGPSCACTCHRRWSPRCRARARPRAQVNECICTISPSAPHHQCQSRRGRGTTVSRAACAWATETGLSFISIILGVSLCLFFCFLSGEPGGSREPEGGTIN